MIGQAIQDAISAAAWQAISAGDVLIACAGGARSDSDHNRNNRQMALGAYVSIAAFSPASFPSKRPIYRKGVSFMHPLQTVSPLARDSLDNARYFVSLLERAASLDLIDVSAVTQRVQRLIVRQPQREHFRIRRAPHRRIDAFYTRSAPESRSRTHQRAGAFAKCVDRRSLFGGAIARGSALPPHGTRLHP